MTSLTVVAICSSPFVVPRGGFPRSGDANRRLKPLGYELFRAVARPPLRPAAFFCSVEPPWRELLLEDDEEPDFLPPRLDAPGELAILAARDFDIPFSFSFSYCFSFLTLGRLPGIGVSFLVGRHAFSPARSGQT